MKSRYHVRLVFNIGEYTISVVPCGNVIGESLPKFNKISSRQRCKFCRAQAKLFPNDISISIEVDKMVLISGIEVACLLGYIKGKFPQIKIIKNRGLTASGFSGNVVTTILLPPTT
jgi:hypothetical protein